MSIHQAGVERQPVEQRRAVDQAAARDVDEHRPLLHPRELVGGVPIALVTVGSPLRDVYAERFPLLYRWVGSGPARFATAEPRAADIGAVEWVNAFRSGDYVGRFMWTPPADALVSKADQPKRP